jgi:C_GCAxxG_C_C family probable redox protein
MKDMTHTEDAVSTFSRGYNCSQAVLSSFSEELGLDKETALKIACGLGAGIGRTNNICGAVSGAILVISLKYGKVHQDDNPAREKTYTLIQKFIRQFTEMNGSVMCTELLGYNLNNPDELKQANGERIFLTRCSEMVRNATDILEDILIS